MAEYVNDTAIGSWYFQAVPTADKLSRMTNNARAAHWNKPRALRYRESALLTTTQVQDLEQTHQLLLSGVRVIRGSACPFPLGPAGPYSYQAADLHRGSWIGEPQVMFPTGIGLPPFVERPVVTCNMIALEIEKTAPDPSLTTFDADYSFVNWYGGLDWGAASGSTPQGTTYDINSMFTFPRWPRCVVARPVTATQTGQAGAPDTLVGLRFRIIVGRLGGAYNWPAEQAPFDISHVHAYYIHWMAMGPVAAY